MQIKVYEDNAGHIYIDDGERIWDMHGATEDGAVIADLLAVWYGETADWTVGVLNRDTANLSASLIVEADSDPHNTDTSSPRITMYIGAMGHEGRRYCGASDYS